MSDLVKRLREKIADNLLAGLPYNRDGDEAADRIEALEAENERLRSEDWFERFEEQEQLRDDAEQRLSVVEAENERLRSLVKHSGGPLCMKRYYKEAECTCGVSAALKEDTRHD